MYIHKYIYIYQRVLMASLVSGVSSPKIFFWPKCLILGE